MMYRLLKPLLFSLPAETAHNLTFGLFKTAHAIPGFHQLISSGWQIETPELEREVFGLRFKNPVGLAAGLDKNAQYLHALKSLGFGFVEVGTVTPKSQTGNPKPRLFRLPEDEALINRMGFNNQGVEVMARRLEKRPDDVIIGGNIGKNKITSNEDAVDDYLTCFQHLADLVDYFVVNVSSPNTPGLRSLQEKEPLTRILGTLQEENAGLTTRRPLLLKIAPDLSHQQLDDIIEIAREVKLAGLIGTNTTIAREPLRSDIVKIEAIGNGGLSGRPLFNRSTDVLSYIAEQTKGTLPIIGVGGIDSAATAKAKLAAGANLVQVYSGLVYKGPGLIKEILKGLIG